MARIGTFLLIPALALTLLLAACGSSSKSDTQASGGSSVTAASNGTLGETVLVDAQGMTLYRLSGEREGHWICTTKSCLAEWHPLPATASGVGGLRTVKRPDGTKQAAFHRMPLYTFAGDQKPGDAKGDGFQDVGTWNAVAASGTPAPGPAPTSTSPSGPYGY